jgi:hypothetical protein
VLGFQKALGKISFTTDVWSDPNQRGFMAITAHWVEGIEEELPTGTKRRFTLRADLIGFRQLPGRHTGQHLAYCFMSIIDQFNIANKVSCNCHS